MKHYTTRPTEPRSDQARYINPISEFRAIRTMARALAAEGGDFPLVAVMATLDTMIGRRCAYSRRILVRLYRLEVAK